VNDRGADNDRAGNNDRPINDDSRHNNFFAGIGGHNGTQRFHDDRFAGNNNGLGGGFADHQAAH